MQKLSVFDQRTTIMVRIPRSIFVVCKPLSAIIIPFLGIASLRIAPITKTVDSLDCRVRISTDEAHLQQKWSGDIDQDCK